MAFSYKAKILCTTACFPVSPQRGINYPPPAFGWRSTLSLQKGKRTVFFPLISFRILAGSHLLLTFFPHCCLFCTALHVLLIYYYFPYPNKVDSTFHHSLKRTVPPFSPERNDEKGFSSLPTIPQYWKFVRIFYKKQTSLPLVRNYGLEGRNDNPLSFLQSALKLEKCWQVHPCLFKREHSAPSDLLPPTSQLSFSHRQQTTFAAFTFLIMGFRNYMDLLFG